MSPPQTKGPNNALPQKEIVVRISPSNDAARLAVAAALLLEPRLVVEIKVPRPGAPPKPGRSRRPLPPGRDPVKAAANEAMVLATWYRVTLSGDGATKEETERRIRLVPMGGKPDKPKVRASLLATGILASALERDPRGTVKRLEAAWLGKLSTDEKKHLDTWIEATFKGFENAVVVLGATRPGPRRRFQRAALSDFAATQLFDIVQNRLGERCVFLNLPLRIPRPGDPTGSKGTDPRHELYVMRRLRDQGCIFAGLSGPLLERAAILGAPALALEPPRGSKTTPRMRDYAGRAPGWLVIETRDNVSALANATRRLKRERAALLAFARHELHGLQNTDLARAESPDPRLSGRAQALLEQLKTLSLDSTAAFPLARRVARSLGRELQDAVDTVRRMGATKRSSIDLAQVVRPRPKAPERITPRTVTPAPTQPPVKRLYVEPRVTAKNADLKTAGFEDLELFASDLAGLATALHAHKNLRREPKLDSEATQAIESALRELFHRRVEIVRRATDRAAAKAAHQPAPAPAPKPGRALWTMAVPKMPVPVAAKLDLSSAKVVVVTKSEHEGKKEKVAVRKLSRTSAPAA